MVPGKGDEVQALKAGIMEIADIFVVNKADREGADRTAASIEAILSLEDWSSDAWRPPVMRTVATTGAGVAELVEMIGRFRAASAATSEVRRRTRAEWRLREILSRRFMQHLDARVLAPGEFAGLLEQIAAREIDPYAAASSVLRRALTGEGASAAAGSDASSVVLDHVGIAVEDAGAFVELFGHLFGLTTDVPENVGQHRVRFIATGDATLELVEPLSPEAPVAKFLEKRGSSLHHVCLRVSDIRAVMAGLKAKGVRFIDDRPRAGAHGSEIAFIHPSSARGLLVELKQPHAAR